MAYDGQDLRSGVFNLTKLLEPGRSLAIKLRRDGELKEFTLQVDKMPPAIEAERKAELMRAVMMPTERRAVAPAGVTMDRSVDDSRPRIAPRVATGRAGFGEAPVTAMARMPMPTGILGAQITEIDQEGLKTLRNDKNANGVVVTRVGEDSPAYRLGLRSGDVIAKVDDVKIESLWQLQHEMVIRRQNVTTKIVVLRGKKTQTLVYEQPNH
jgi:S1-C subfamily serine protease